MGERFYFNDPKILEGLFSFRKGWFIYTPIMIFAIVGLFFLPKNIRLPLFIFSLLNIYVIFSWWCWWYGGTYGQRSMIDSYALMAIPLAFFIKYLLDKGPVLRYGFLSICAFFIWLNIFQTYQFERGSLHYDGMTKALYFRQFGKLDRINNFDKMAERPDYEKARERY